MRVRGIALTTQGRNTKGEEGLFPATYIEQPEINNVEPQRSQTPESPRGGRSSPTPPPTVMGPTLDSIQQAIESIAKPEVTPQVERNGEPDHDELGIGQTTRAKLAEQAKIANEQKERQRASGGVAGLVYSDESDDDSVIQSPAMVSSVPDTPAAPAPISSQPVAGTDPRSWTVVQVHTWAISKGFEQAICDKFIGELPQQSIANL